MKCPKNIIECTKAKNKTILIREVYINLYYNDTQKKIDKLRSKGYDISPLKRCNGVIEAYAYGDNGNDGTVIDITYVCKVCGQDYKHITLPDNKYSLELFLNEYIAGEI